MPRDHPIIFSGPMVRALIDGRKTQTRRLATSPLRRVEAGDRLYVREKWQLHSRASDLCSIVYGASEGRSWTEMHEQFPDALAVGMSPRPFQSGWRPSIHMPRWASRLTLIVESVRFQPLQAISDEDCQAEGIGPPYLGDGEPPFEEQAVLVSRRMQYRNLWSTLHGRASWDANPEVVAIGFSVREGNIDRQPAGARPTN